MTRTASAVWKGGLKDGSGTMSTQSGVLTASQYSFKTRFEDGIGTNPEELIAAAHAGCFSMAFSNILGQAGIGVESIETTAAITLENLTLTKSDLTTVVTAPGADKKAVEEAAQKAKAGCPISKVLNLEISLDLTVKV